MWLLAGPDPGWQTPLERAKLAQRPDTYIEACNLR